MTNAFDYTALPALIDVTAAEATADIAADTTVAELTDFMMLLNESSLGSPQARASVDLALAEPIIAETDTAIDARIVHAELLAADRFAGAGDQDAARRALRSVLVTRPTPETWPLQVQAAARLETDQPNCSEPNRTGQTSTPRGFDDDAHRLRWLARAARVGIDDASDRLETVVAAYFDHLLSMSPTPTAGSAAPRDRSRDRAASLLPFAALGIDNALLRAVLTNWVGGTTADLLLQGNTIGRRLEQVLAASYKQALVSSHSAALSDAQPSVDTPGATGFHRLWVVVDDLVTPHPQPKLVRPGCERQYDTIWALLHETLRRPFGDLLSTGGALPCYPLRQDTHSLHRTLHRVLNSKFDPGTTASSWSTQRWAPTDFPSWHGQDGDSIALIGHDLREAINIHSFCTHDGDVKITTAPQTGDTSLIRRPGNHIFQSKHYQYQTNKLIRTLIQGSCVDDGRAEFLFAGWLEFFYGCLMYASLLADEGSAFPSSTEVIDDGSMHLASSIVFDTGGGGINFQTTLKDILTRIPDEAEPLLRGRDSIIKVTNAPPDFSNHVIINVLAARLTSTGLKAQMPHQLKAYLDSRDRSRPPAESPVVLDIGGRTNTRMGYDGRQRQGDLVVIRDRPPVTRPRSRGPRLLARSRQRADRASRTG